MKNQERGDSAQVDSATQTNKSITTNPSHRKRVDAYPDVITRLPELWDQKIETGRKTGKPKYSIPKLAGILNVSTRTLKSIIMDMQARDELKSRNNKLPDEKEKELETILTAILKDPTNPENPTNQVLADRFRVSIKLIKTRIAKVRSDLGIEKRRGGGRIGNRNNPFGRAGSKSEQANSTSSSRRIRKGSSTDSTDPVVDQKSTPPVRQSVLNETTGDWQKLSSYLVSYPEGFVESLTEMELLCVVAADRDLTLLDYLVNNRGFSLKRIIEIAKKAKERWDRS